MRTALLLIAEISTKNLFTIPASADTTLKSQWIHFIYYNNVPATLDDALYVCGDHFSLDCFPNLGRYKFFTWIKRRFNPSWLNNNSALCKS